MLSLAQLQAEGTIYEITSLEHKNKNLSNVDVVSQCSALRRLDLSHNAIPSLSFLSRCANLTVLNLSYNVIKEIAFITKLSKLSVLNLSNNQIKSIKGLDGLTTLKALILNNNEISSLQGLDKNLQLNTLGMYRKIVQLIVLSHNKLAQAHNLDHLYSLVKLSLSHNQLKTFRTGGGLESLEELRLNDNAIREVDGSVSTLTNLKLLDLGRNKIVSLDSLEQLSSLERLTNFNILGNGVQNDCEYFRSLFGALRIYNSQPVGQFQASVVFDRTPPTAKKLKKKIKLNTQLELEVDAFEEQQIVKAKAQARKGKSAQVRLTNHSLDADTKAAIQRTKGKLETVLEATNKFESWD